MPIKPTKAVTRAELRDVVHKAMPQLSRLQAGKLVDEVFEEIMRALEQNEGVKIRGFGNFKLQHKAERIGRNPKTGEDAVITARRVVKFAPSPILTALINGESIDGLDNEE